jgi:hypothetical protein
LDAIRQRAGGRAWRAGAKRAASRAAVRRPYARIKPNVLKLATLLAASRNPAEPIVDWPDIDTAAAMVLESVSTTIEGVKTHVSDSDHHARVKKIRKIVRNAGSIT